MRRRTTGRRSRTPPFEGAAAVPEAGVFDPSLDGVGWFYDVDSLDSDNLLVTGTKPSVS